LIRKIAENIETYETNKNLVLTEGARADSVPNLEIETGEIIGAGHSSTTGRFDDEQLFYLTSRGIDPDEAKRLVVMGFFVEIIRRIGIDDLEGAADRRGRAGARRDRRHRQARPGGRVSWTVACPVAELEEDLPFSVDVDGELIALVSTEGEVFAIQDAAATAT
jgi:hypothetical protein